MRSQPNRVAAILYTASSSRYLWYIVPGLLLATLLSFLFYQYHSDLSVDKVVAGLNGTFLIFLLIGLFAQLVDSTLGMGYGATATSFLLAAGVPPAVSSTGVHLAEMFTTGASAIAHYRYGNVNRKLVRYLIIPGVMGSIAGAYLLSEVINGDAIKPYISLYMIVLAVMIILKGLRKKLKKKKTRRLGPLAAFGGFMDAIGGGGWGPIVTSTLIGKGRDPRYTIGSVIAAEFAVSFASGVTLLLFVGITGWQVIAGLILGGFIAAPFGAALVNKIPRKVATVFVGILLILLSVRSLLNVFVWT